MGIVDNSIRNALERDARWRKLKQRRAPVAWRPVEDVGMNPDAALSSPEIEIETLGGLAPESFGSSMMQKERARRMDQYGAENVPDAARPWSLPAPAEETAPTAPAEVSPMQKRLRDLYEERARLENDPIEDDDSKLKNFWKGLQYGGRLSLATGNLGYGVGSMLGHGLRNLFMGKEDDERERKEKIAETQKKIAEAEKAYDAEMKARKAQAEIEGQIIRNQQSGLDYIRSVNKPFYDSIMADDLVTPEEAAEAKKRGFGDIVPYDKRRFDTMTIDGEVVATPSLGAPDYQPTNAPKSKLKAPIERKLDDGTIVYTTGDKLLDDQIAEKYRQAQMNFDASKFNASEANKYEKDLTSWRDSVASAGGDVSRIAQELDALLKLDNDNFEGDRGDLQTKIAIKKGEYAKAKSTYEDRLKNMPKPPKTVSAPNLQLPKVSEQTFRSQLKAKYPQMTEAQIKAAVQKARTDGVIQ